MASNIPTDLREYVAFCCKLVAYICITDNQMQVKVERMLMSTILLEVNLIYEMHVIICCVDATDSDVVSVKDTRSSANMQGNFYFKLSKYIL